MDRYFNELCGHLEDVAGEFSVTELRRFYNYLEREYRGASSGQALVLADAGLVASYVATRLPATVRVLMAIMTELKQRDAAFAPTSMLDLGSGPGSAVLAALAIWPQLRSVVAVERERACVKVAQSLVGRMHPEQLSSVEWIESDLRRVSLVIKEPASLVVASYVLAELSTPVKEALLERMADWCADYCLLVEPGTPEGFERIKVIRSFMIKSGFKVLSPCASEGVCPSQWCHFSLRVPRAKLHRLVKEGSLSYEFEHYAYVLLSRKEPLQRVARIVARPAVTKHSVELQLCSLAAQLETRAVSRRAEPKLYKLAKSTRWGDSWHE